MQQARCVVYFKLIIGWRRFMEDAMIAKCPTHDGGEVSLFAIFDGHGGTS